MKSRKIRMLLAVFLLGLSLVSCGPAELREVKEELLTVYEDALNFWGRLWLTGEHSLAGEIERKDDYYGTYHVEAIGEEGKETVFGGTSTEERTVRLKGRVTAGNGTARILVRMGTGTYEIEPEEDGSFNRRATFSGGFYVTVRYDGFTGELWLTSSEE